MPSHSNNKMLCLKSPVWFDCRRRRRFYLGFCQQVPLWFVLPLSACPLAECCLRFLHGPPHRDGNKPIAWQNSRANCPPPSPLAAMPMPPLKYPYRRAVGRAYFLAARRH